MRWLARRWPWLIAPLLAALVGWGWWRGNLAVRDSRRELADLQSRKRQLADSNRVLAREVEALKTEREARARAAREAMDAAAPGEVLVIVPTPPPTTPAP